jgi:hypothetical protein
MKNYAEATYNSLPATSYLTASIFDSVDLISYINLPSCCILFVVILREQIALFQVIFCFQIDQQWMEIVNLYYPISCLLFFYCVCVSTFILSMSISFASKMFFILSKFTSLIPKPTSLFVSGVSRGE